MKSRNLIIKKFKEVKNKGFIPASRSGNTAIGKTFEDVMEIKENNDKLPDFGAFEVKSLRFLSSSKITLFTLKPSYPLNANQLLLSKYGYSTNPTKPPSLHTSFTVNPNSLKQKHSLYLKVNKRSKKVNIHIDNLENKTTESDYYYTFQDLKNATNKLTNLFVVTAETKIVKSKEFFHFTNAKMYFGFQFDKFIEKLEKGFIQYDIRMGYYKSGDSKGKPHDHGSGFRIQRDSLADLYEQFIEID